MKIFGKIQREQNHIFDRSSSQGFFRGFQFRCNQTVSNSMFVEMLICLMMNNNRKHLLCSTIYHKLKNHLFSSDTQSVCPLNHSILHSCLPAIFSLIENFPLQNLWASIFHSCTLCASNSRIFSNNGRLQRCFAPEFWTCAQLRAFVI